MSKTKAKKFKNASETLPKIGRHQAAAVEAKVNGPPCVYLIHVFHRDLCRLQHFDVAVELGLNVL